MFLWNGIGEMHNIQLCIPFVNAIWMIVAAIATIIGHLLIKEWLEEGVIVVSSWAEDARLNEEVAACMAAAAEEEELIRITGPIRVRDLVAFTRDSLGAWSAEEVEEEEEDFYLQLAMGMGDCEVLLV